jgi:outer membrane protein OmpA-like peptidoglycan-associated protein
MSVIGHTDLVGPEGYNRRLGLQRARAAVRYLVSKGVDPSRLDAVASAGESEPVVATEDRERRNRRAVTVVAGLDRVYVGPNLDGEYAASTYDVYQGSAAD